MPIARGLKGGRGCPRRALNLEKLSLIERASRRAIASTWRKSMKRLGLGIIVALGLTLPAFGQGVDPLIGVWKLNFEKSTFTIPLFKSLTLTITGEGQNRTLTAEGVTVNSQSFTVVYQHVYDGQPHPTTGTPDFDSSTYARIGNTINFIRFKNGAPSSGWPLHTYSWKNLYEYRSGYRPKRATVE
jgi:hypothetical protein